jgi:hypothetical protein
MLATAVLVCSTMALVVADDTPVRKSADELSEIKQLPNPFLFLDGSAVRSKEDWDRRHRELNRPDFYQFVGHVDRLPIDQQLLRALVAPRALLATGGTQDAWTNPQGSQLTHLAAQRVYAFLGARDRISIRDRPIGHIPGNEDLLVFADHVYFGKPLSDEFGKLPYPEERDGFDWDVPR